ncbi:hypothetical protein [Amycolatopsis sp. NPDC004169]|uniref:hypothetical protein n=1 Tax=Amycolatopsis sp. NPDC004169 TaxID=3154453 RepID=UPI0033BB7B9C
MAFCETTVWGGLVALGASWLSFAVIQLPIQLHIRETAERPAIVRLVRTDWIRVLAMVAHFAFAVVAIAVAG